MNNFSREKYGYSIKEVDQFIARFNAEHELELKRQSNIISVLKKENDEMKALLTKHIQNEQRLSDALRSAEQKSQNVAVSVQNVYELKTKQMQLLYRKWEKVLDSLQERYSNCISSEEINDITYDFHHALSLTIDENSDQDEDKVYAQQILTRMTGRSSKQGHNYRAVSVRKHVMGKNFETVSTSTKISTQVNAPSSAEKFLNGEGVDLPASMGMLSKSSLNIISNQENKNEKSKSGFSLEEALVPTDSLEEIMKSFDVDDL